MRRWTPAPWIREKENILFLGPLGVGKSQLAAAIEVNAGKNGVSLNRFLLDDLIHVLKQEAAMLRSRLHSKRYTNSALLVGFRPLDRHEANVYFRAVFPPDTKRAQ